jgi:hypothetical protein
MSIKSKARRRGIARAIASLSNAAIDVHGQQKIVICGLLRYNSYDGLAQGTRATGVWLSQICSSDDMNYFQRLIWFAGKGLYGN